MAPKLLRLSIAARRCGVSERTLKRWLYDGKMAGLKTRGGHWRIPESEIPRLTQKTVTSQDTTHYH